jgi:hypothetical protein
MLPADTVLGVDTVVHPDYRHRHIGKFMVKEAIRHFEKKDLRIDRIRGKLGWADEITEEDKMVRDTFWQSMSFVVDQRQIRATRENLKLEKIKTHRITEREYMLEIENEFLRQQIHQQRQQIENLNSLIKQKTKQSWFKSMIKR